MKLAHIIAIIAFGISFLICGGNYAQGVQTGAAWGFWISLVIGGLFLLIMLAVSIIGLISGTAAGVSLGGPLGGLVGFFGVGGILLISTIIGIGAILLAVFGYDALRAWGASNLEDKTLLIRACVLLGLSILLSLLSSSHSSSN